MLCFARRRAVLLVAATALGAGSLTTASQAVGATSPIRATASGVLDPVVTTALSLINAGSTPDQVQNVVTLLGLNTTQIGLLLGAANSGQLNAILKS